MSKANVDGELDRGIDYPSPGSWPALLSWPTRQTQTRTFEELLVHGAEAVIHLPTMWRLCEPTSLLEEPAGAFWRDVGDTANVAFAIDNGAAEVALVRVKSRWQAQRFNSSGRILSSVAVGWEATEQSKPKLEGPILSDSASPGEWGGSRSQTSPDLQSAGGKTGQHGKTLRRHNASTDVFCCAGLECGRAAPFFGRPPPPP